MQSITSIEDLKSTIKQLEDEQVVKGLELKEHLLLTYQSLKPLNLMMNALEEIALSPNILDNVLAAGTGLATGYISNKLFIGTKGGKLRKLFGTLLQYAVSSVVARNPETVKLVGNFIFQNLFSRNKRKIKQDLNE